MRDKYLILNKKKNMAVFHGTVSGVPRYGHFQLVKGLSLELQK